MAHKYFYKLIEVLYTGVAREVVISERRCYLFHRFQEFGKCDIRGLHIWLAEYTSSGVRFCHGIEYK